MIATNGNSLNIQKRMTKLWFILTMKYYLAMKMNDQWLHATPWLIPSWQEVVECKRGMCVVLHGCWLCLLATFEVDSGLSPLWSHANFTSGFLLVQMLGLKARDSLCLKDFFFFFE